MFSLRFNTLGQGKVNEMFQEEKVIELSQKYHKTPAQILLRYNVQNGVIVIPKSIHEDRIQENINIFDFELTKQEMNALKSLNC